MIEEKLERIPSLINRTEVKRKLLQQAKDTKPWHPFTQVSKATLDEAEAHISAWVRRHIEGLPSRGKTI